MTLRKYITQPLRSRNTIFQQQLKTMKLSNQNSSPALDLQASGVFAIKLYFVKYCRISMRTIYYYSLCSNKNSKSKKPHSSQ
jgi:hypothetical protein